MARKIFNWVIIAAFTAVGSNSVPAQSPGPVCVTERAALPEQWRASDDLRESLETRPWSVAESQQVARAIEAGVDEIIEHFESHLSAFVDLWDDSISALVDSTHASANDPALDYKIHRAARANLERLLKPHIVKAFEGDTCGDFQDFLPLAIFAHRLFGPEHEYTVWSINTVNDAYRHCESLEEATGIDPEYLSVNQNAFDVNLEKLFDIYIWSVWFLEAERISELKLPVEAQKFAPIFWANIKKFHWPDAEDIEGGVRNKRFFTLADLAAHVAHIPTGVHRYPIYVEDDPELYDFFRRNFYHIMEQGDLDLFASFVDSLRQYGCTPQNDVHVRDGTRHLIRLFNDHDQSWMNYRKQRPRGEGPNHYALIHTPWTAVLGIRERKMISPRPGTLGAHIRRRLSLPNKKVR